MADFLIWFSGALTTMMVLFFANRVTRNKQYKLDLESSLVVALFSWVAVAIAIVMGSMYFIGTTISESTKYKKLVEWFEGA